MRLRDFVRFLEAHGVAVKSDGAKHQFRATREGARLYTIPAHNGVKTELDDKYLKGCCKHFGLDRNAWKGWKG